MPQKPTIPRVCEHCHKPFFTYPSQIRAGIGRFCSRSCAGSNSAQIRNKLPEHRFWENVQKTNGCWIWTSGTVAYGYGNLCINGKMQRTHRYSWELHNGPIPDGLFVLHKCDNPLCVNPAHLFLGTHQDNMDDKMSKGRHVSLRGSSHGNAKLDESDVIEIRRRYTSTGITQAELGREYGVDRTTISLIVRRKKWAHLPPDSEIA